MYLWILSAVEGFGHGEVYAIDIFAILSIKDGYKHFVNNANEMIGAE